MEKERIQNLYHELKTMRLSGMADVLIDFYENPNHELIAADEIIEQMISAEYDLRSSKKINKLIRRSHIRYPEAVIDEVTYAPERHLDIKAIEKLSECRWIEERKNLIITGLTGAGKTYMACALGMAAIHQFKNVYYTSANLLIMELQKAENQGTILDELKALAKFDLIIIDDFGLMNLELNVCRNLFQLISEREGRSSIMIVSQIPVANWYDLFQEATFADAFLDRICHKAYRLEFNGESLRKKTHKN